jgi:tight adherence protein C
MPPALIALVAFGVVAVPFIGAAALLSRRSSAVQLRLRAIASPAAAAAGEFTVFADEGPKTLFERVLMLLGRRGQRADEAEHEEGIGLGRRQTKRDTRHLLLQAGIRRPNALSLFIGIRVAVAGTVFVFGFFAATVIEPALFPAVFAFAVAGYLLPGLLLGRLAKARRADIRRNLPDAIDLLLLCVEAGLGLNAALLRVAEERSSGSTADAVGDEMLVLAKELQVGMTRREALRNFADRTGLDEVRALAAQLIQSERLGSSIGGALRAQSESIRTQRRLEAEEQANKTQIKLLFPLILFIFPSVMIVILMPAVLRMVTALVELTP